MPTDFRRVAIGPGAFDQRPAGMGVPSLRDTALPAPLASRVFRWCEAQIVHQLSRGIETGEVPEFGHRGHRNRELDATQGLEGFDHRGEPPRRHLRCEFLLQARKTFGLLHHSSDVFLEHDLLR